MNAEIKNKVLSYLEDFQRDCLRDRFGENYEAEFKKYQVAKVSNFDIEEYLASQPSMSESEKQEFREFSDLHEKLTKPHTQFQDIQSFSILQMLFEK